MQSEYHSLTEHPSQAKHNKGNHSNTMTDNKESVGDNDGDGEKRSGLGLRFGRRDRNSGRSGGRRNMTTAKRIDALLRDVEIIQVALDGKKPMSKERAQLDTFQQQKFDLSETLTRIREDIKTEKTIEKRDGSTAQTIRLKKEIEKNIATAKRQHAQLEQQYDSDMRDYDRNGSFGDSKITNEEMKQREELVQLLKQDLDFRQHEYQPKKETRGGGFQLARNMREQRKKRRDQGLGSDEPVPLTADQQAFIQETIERDRQLDDQLDVIKMGVRQLNAIGQDINEEFDKQKEMLQEVGDKMDQVQDKLESRNKQLKELLDKSGGVSRWCPVFVLLIILLACLGYIYNAFIA